MVHTHAGFVPARAALEELSRVLGSVRREVPVAPARGGLFGRRVTPQAAKLEEISVERLPIDSVRLPVAGFGNLTAADAREVTRVLREAATEWLPHTLRFAGIDLVETADLIQVWAPLEGDCDALMSIARDIAERVERLRLYVDRRAFRPAVQVASCASTTPADDLEALSDAFGSWIGQTWSVDTLTLFAATYTDGRSEWREIEQIPLGDQRDRQLSDSPAIPN